LTLAPVRHEMHLAPWSTYVKMSGLGRAMVGL
jgi:hypothetical protein